MIARPDQDDQRPKLPFPWRAVLGNIAMVLVFFAIALAAAVAVYGLGV